MKKMSIALLLLFTSWVYQACNGNEKGSTDTNNTNSTKDSTEATRTTTDTGRSAASMMDTSNKMANASVTDKDATDFVMKAADGGMMEVALGKVAQQNAKNDRVKSFGSMMVTDHTKANDELKGIASSKNITIPPSLSPAHQKMVDDLSKKTGASFDKAYMNMMVNDHKEDVGEFKKASTNVKDADIKGFAARTLPVLQKHLDSAQAINK